MQKIASITEEDDKDVEWVSKMVEEDSEQKLGSITGEDDEELELLSKMLEEDYEQEAKDNKLQAEIEDRKQQRAKRKAQWLAKQGDGLHPVVASFDPAQVPHMQDNPPHPRTVARNPRRWLNMATVNLAVWTAWVTTKMQEAERKAFRNLDGLMTEPSTLSPALLLWLDLHGNLKHTVTRPAQPQTRLCLSAAPWPSQRRIKVLEPSQIC